MLILLHIKCQVLLCFLHDKSVLFCSDHLSVTTMKAYMTGNDMNGVHGIACIVSPG